jgi:uncharacterized membrane protein
MYDLISIVGTMILLAMSILYVHGCELLTSNRKATPHA